MAANPHKVKQQKAGWQLRRQRRQAKARLAKQRDAARRAKTSRSGCQGERPSRAAKAQAGGRGLSLWRLMLRAAAQQAEAKRAEAQN